MPFLSKSLGCRASSFPMQCNHFQARSRRDVPTSVVKLEIFCTQVLGGKHCPSPSCGRLVIPSQCSDDENQNGWNIMQCFCGQSPCGNCTLGAHLGTSCHNYKKMRDDIASGKSDAEYESQKYILENSLPCPRCSFGIERDGGCNHVICTKCQHYFCWRCGGPGADCASYYCQKSGKRWLETSVSADTDEHRHLSSLVETYRSCRIADRNLEKLVRVIQKFGGTSNFIEPSALVFELQLGSGFSLPIS
jgi:IBR domain, a half RING-finger domain